MQRPTRIDDFDVPVWWDCVWRRVPCGADACRFCGRLNAQRKKHIDRGEDPDSYANTFVVKTARDVDNVRALEKGDEMVRVDFAYTRYVLIAVCSILDNAFAILEGAVRDQRTAFAELRADLARMTEEMNLSPFIRPPSADGIRAGIISEYAQYRFGGCVEKST